MQRDENSKTALMLAMTTARRSYDYRKDLLGVEIKILDGQTIFDIWTSRTSEVTTTQITQILIKAGADVNIADRYGRTPLMLVVENFFDTTPIMQMLINAGADVNAKDNRGRTILTQILMQVEQTLRSKRVIRRAILEETIEMLIDAGAKS